MIPPKNYIENFISLFYPRLCCSCGNTLRGNEKMLCTACMHTLPETGFHRSMDHPVMEVFAGRLPLEYALSLLFFEKGSKYRNLIYQLKYGGRKDSGTFLGKLIGARICEGDLKLPDYIIPVPLHKAKLRRRGYNQSTVIAEGISSVIRRPVLEKILIRKQFSSTQTRKGRYERWQNVEGIFACHSPEKLTDRHILLVDDVVTTGATLEAAGSCLIPIPGISLAIATAAYAAS